MKLVLSCATFSTPTRYTFRCQFIQYNQYDSFLFLVSVESNPAVYETVPRCARSASRETLTSTWRQRNRGLFRSAVICEIAAHVAPSPPKSRGRESRRKFSLLQSLEKSDNAEILRRHREAPCLPNVGAARRASTAKRSGPEMAPQRFEKIKSAPGNGMVWEASNPQDMVHGRAADHARLRLTSRRNALLQKKAPNALKSLDAELKLQPRSTARRRGLAGRRPGCFLAAPRDDGWRP